MNVNNLLRRIEIVRDADHDPHGPRMAVLGYIGAMLELEQISVTEYLRAGELVNNAHDCRAEELRNAL